ncbi:GNAT family N-acetyltransferase [Parabacteroides sp. PF5-9]|uniref:GNAT family N-acetyltransferase n=1 Tax=Parabacteroides sp. PF5-9 TaxID=1742404 RepID=UPI0032AF55A8
MAHKEVEIKPATSYPYPLLLLADPEQEKVDGYLKNSDCFVATLNGQTVGVIVVQKQSEKTAEIMNLAVDESFQRRGIARKLLRYITNQWAATAYITRLIIRTGTSAPGPFMLYQQEGFDLKNVEYNYFVHHYKEPIFENGVQCRHQLIMEKVIPDPTETF